MTSMLAVQKQIRRALQSPLHTAAKAAGMVDSEGNPLIQWKGIPFDREIKVPHLAAEIGFGKVVVHEVGKTPMMEAAGHVTVVCRSPSDGGEDANDLLAAIVDAAYPYASTPTFGGITVNIDKSEHQGYGSDGPWFTGLISVDWNIYRRTP